MFPAEGVWGLFFYGWFFFFYFSVEKGSIIIFHSPLGGHLP